LTQPALICHRLSIAQCLIDDFDDLAPDRAVRNIRRMNAQSEQWIPR